MSETNDESVFRRHGLAIVCGGIFAVLLVFQLLTGWRSANNEALLHHGATEGLISYIVSGHFVEATLENWESEFLQMAAFIVLTAVLIERGSAESKQPDGDPRDEDPRRHRADPGAPWPVRRGGLWLKLYENSLVIVFGLLFAASFVGHLVGGAHEATTEAHLHGEPGVGAWQFLRSADFWFQSFQNWQSEFLAVAAMALLTIWLRQKGSAESKPVHAPHAETGGG